MIASLPISGPIWTILFWDKMCPGEVKTTINFFLAKNGPFSPNFKKALGASMRRDNFVTVRTYAPRGKTGMRRELGYRRMIRRNRGSQRVYNRGTYESY